MTHRALFLTASVLSLLIALAGQARAELQLASPFTDHAVLQRNMPVPVWGTGDAGAKVTVTLLDASPYGVREVNPTAG